jgi:hypothetical protein
MAVPFFTPDKHAADRLPGQRSRVPLGHPTAIARAAGMRGRRAPAHARGVGGVPARAGISAGVLTGGRRL